MKMNKTIPGVNKTIKYSSKEELTSSFIKMIQSLLKKENKLSPKEIEILTELVLLQPYKTDIQEQSVKDVMYNKLKIKSKTMDTWNQRLRDKDAIIMKNNKYIVNPIYMIDKETNKIDLTIKLEYNDRG